MHGGVVGKVTGQYFRGGNVHARQGHARFVAQGL